jgi:sulfane dehydrogenase subunit SoxC
MTMGLRRPRPFRRAGGVKTVSEAELSRREFIRGGAGAAGGLLAAGAVPEALAAGNPAHLPPNVPPWSRVLGASVDAHPYGMPSPHERHVVRRGVEWLTPTREASVNFTPLHALDGIITPNGLCFERHHGGAPVIPPEDHRLLVHGLVERPLLFTLDDLAAFPPESRFYFLECAANGGMEWRGAQLNGCQYTHGMIHCVQYTGVPLGTLLAECGVEPAGRWLLAEGADAAGMSRSIPLDKAMEDCFVAYAMNGERLRTEQGYPLRLLVPGWEGSTWVKWLRRVEVGDQPWHHREETSRYTDLLADGKARQFSFVMEAKSVITSPSPQRPLGRRGRQLIKGLAWSGRGAVRRVDVSLDGGRNWRTARLDEPVLPKCLTRFYLEWEWHGEQAYLQSRAIDETGYVQPQMQALVAARGENSVYHNNAIQTWMVTPSGALENVRLG